MKATTIGRRCHFGRKMTRTLAGLTLVEVLVVIVIVTVLAVAIFAFSKRGLESAKASTCMSNVKQVGLALLMHAADNNNKLIPLQPAENPSTGKRPPIWPVQLAQGGYLSQWDGRGDAPCGTGVWTCPDCDFMSQAYGGFGVVEGAIFVYEESRPSGGVTESGSLRLSRIADHANTWLVGDASRQVETPEKGWYAIWSNPASWVSHGPAARHGGKANICMVDGHVERLAIAEIKKRKLTEDVTK